MSDFIRDTYNPRNGNLEPAHWMDDYYGKHRYGVKFPDGSVYPEARVEVPEEFTVNGDKCEGS